MNENRNDGLFECDDLRSYLRSLMEREEKRVGLRQLAKRAGMSTPSNLSSALNGKRAMSRSMAEKLAKALLLTGKRQRYFLTLAEIDRSKTVAQKNALKHKLIEFRKSKIENLQDRQYQFLATWFYPVIFLLVGMKNFQNNPEWIAQRLGRGVTVKQVEHALSDLVALDFLEQTQEGLKQKSTSLKTTDDVKNLAIYQYHKNMNQIADAALEQPLEKREFNGMTLDIPEKLVPEFKRRIRQFRESMEELSNQFTDAENVYQLNIQFFQLTEKSHENKI